MSLFTHGTETIGAEVRRATRALRRASGMLEASVKAFDTAVGKRKDVPDLAARVLRHRALLALAIRLADRTFERARQAYVSTIGPPIRDTWLMEHIGEEVASLALTELGAYLEDVEAGGDEAEAAIAVRYVRKRLGAVGVPPALAVLTRLEAATIADPRVRIQKQLRDLASERDAAAAVQARAVRSNAEAIAASKQAQEELARAEAEAGAASKLAEHARAALDSARGRVAELVGG